VMDYFYLFLCGVVVVLLLVLFMDKQAGIR